jgi:hypothetical protein
MAEIKSTLELVLERTRHLTLTAEEKRQQSIAEFKKSVRGLIQKCQDGMLTPERFREELQRMQSTSQVIDNGIAFDEIAQWLDVDEDSTWVLHLLEEVFAINSQAMKAVSEEYHSAVDRAAQRRIEVIRMELAENKGISGTAIVPNLAGDQKWEMERQSIHRRFESAWDRELKRLKSSR